MEKSRKKKKKCLSDFLPPPLKFFLKTKNKFSLLACVEGSFLQVKKKKKCNQFVYPTCLGHENIWNIKFNVSNDFCLPNADLSPLNLLNQPHILSPSFGFENLGIRNQTKNTVQNAIIYLNKKKNVIIFQFLLQ